MSTAPIELPFRRRVRVLQLLTQDEPGGTELMTLSLVSHLDRQLFDVHVALLSRRSSLALEYDQIGVPVFELSGHQGMMTAVRSMITLFRRNHYDVVHVYGFKASLIARFVSRVISRQSAVLDGIRSLSVGAVWEKGDLKSEASLLVGRVCSYFVDYHVTNSRTAMEFLTSYGRLSRKKFVVIPNGLDIEFWRSDMKERKGNTIVCVALFRAAKRHQDLVEALHQLAQKGLMFECLLAGEGPERERIQELVMKLRLDDRVRFVGQLDRRGVRDLLALSDIFVLPSVVEGLPGSVMEAMASGLPVVATNSGGTSELVAHAHTGFLIPLRRPDLLAQHIQILLQDSELRVAMGDRGRKRINEEFSLNAMVEQTANLYSRISSSRSASRYQI